jgi:glycosyltransferase involved in cell wall biosynthesis
VKILIIHNRYRQPGGEDVVVQSQAELLRSHGHEVRLYEKDNREIDRYGLFRKGMLFLNTADNSTVAAEVAELVGDFKPAVAHIHNTLPLISPSIYRPLKQAGVKVIQYLHNYRLVCPAGTLWRDGQHCQLCVDESLKHAVTYKCWSHSTMATLAVTRMLDRHRRAGTWQREVDLFVALNSYMRDLLVKKGVVPPNNIVVQGNFSVDMEPPKDVTPSDEFVFAGRLTEEKGVRLLIDVAEKTTLPLTIIGDGPLHADVVKASQQHPHLKAPGHLPREEVLKRMAAAHAVVFPSHWQEPFGLSIIEAMALGKPVIASRVAGPQEIVQGGVTGLLFDAGNVEQLAACMRRLQENGELAVQLGTAGRARYEQEYSPAAGYRHMLDNYRRLGLAFE